MEIMEEGKTFYFKKSKTGILLIHGFTGTSSSLRPMGEFLAEKEITVLGIRLPGHGTSVEDMMEKKAEDWIKAAEDGLKKIRIDCDNVFVSGLSMGGTLTLHLAANYPKEIKGIITINAPVFIKDVRLIFLPILKYILKSIPAVAGDLKDPGAKEIAYERTPVKCIPENLKLNSMVKKEMTKISIPSLIFQSKEDHVVHPSNGQYIYDNISSEMKELTWLENSYHVATLDFDKELIFSKTYEFINKIVSSIAQ